MRYATGIYDDGDPTLLAQARSGWLDLGRAFEEEHGMPVESFDDLLSLQAPLPEIAEMVEELARTRFDEFRAPDYVELVQPLNPRKIICVGRNYRKHVEEMGNDIPTVPLIFDKISSSCIGPEDAIVADPALGQIDHEGELAVIIGDYAKDIEPEEAYEYIAGYTLLNDVTARDWQKRLIAAGHPWFLAKNIDTFCPIGPVVVTRDHLAWPPAVTIEVEVNGELRQRGDTRSFIFPLPELLSYITRYIALEPGDVVATGTPDGVGPLRPGDEVVVRVEEIGELRNYVVTPEDEE